MAGLCHLNRRRSSKVMLCAASSDKQSRRNNGGSKQQKSSGPYLSIGLGPVIAESTCDNISHARQVNIFASRQGVATVRYSPTPEQT
jgi:hypothetical protein